jgi:hypothetical protein
LHSTLIEAASAGLERFASIVIDAAAAGSRTMGRATTNAAAAVVAVREVLVAAGIHHPRTPSRVSYLLP